LLAFLLAIALIYSVLSPDFRTAQTVWDLLREVAPNAIAAVGITLLMLSGEFDLSIGSVLAIVGIVTINVFNWTQGLGPDVSLLCGLAAGLATGLVIGVVNGLLVTRAGMNSLMVTLGMMFLLRGIVYVWTGKTPIADEQGLESFKWIFHGSIGPLPVPALLAAAVAAAFYWVLTQTPFGRDVYASGGNPQAARVSGIQVQRLKFWSFVICSLLASVAGILLTAQIDNGYFDTGSTGFELMVIAAVVLGGVSLAGGEGSLVGAMLGVLIIGVTNKGLRLLNVYTTWQLVVIGVAIIVAVYAYLLRRRLLASRSR